MLLKNLIIDLDIKNSIGNLDIEISNIHSDSRKIKENGLLIGLATNPVFPAIATESRVSWAGLSKSDFELITTYENFTSIFQHLFFD